MNNKINKFNLVEDDFFYQVEEETKYCKKCKTKNVKQANFCYECGCNEFVTSLKKENKDVKYCARCQKEVSKNVKFCPECGSNEFILSAEDDSNALTFEIDAKYEKELKKILKKIDDCQKEIADINAKNSAIEKQASITNDIWNKKIEKVHKEEDAVLKKNKKSNDALNVYKKELSTLENDIKELEKKIKAVEKNTEAFKKKTVDIAKKKSDSLNQFYSLKEEKAGWDSRFAQQEKARIQAELLAKQKAERERLEAERKAKEEERKLQARLEEIRRENLPEVRFSKALTNYKNRFNRDSFTELEKLSNEGYGPSHLFLGLMYEYGMYPSKDLNKARMLYQKSASAGDRIGRFKASNVGLEFYSVIPEDILKELVNLRDGTAYMTMGKRCFDRKNTIEYSNAQNWFDKAMFYGFVSAGYYSAEANRLGYGSFTKRMKDYQYSAEKGHTDACIKLAEIYKSGMPGFDIPKDNEKYKYWMQKAKGR